MEKGAMTSSSGGASAPGPLPSAPPSYEEAVGLSMGGGPMMPVAVPMPGAPPYPAVHMPMPTPYAAPIAVQQHQMPMPAVHPQQHVGVPAPVPSAVHHHQQQQQQQHHQQAPQPQVRIVGHADATHSLGPNPIKMSCPSCHADIKTATISDHQPSAHVCCIVLCLLGCCLCSCLPYCVSAFLRVHHICPNCKAYIGTWKG